MFVFVVYEQFTSPLLVKRIEPNTTLSWHFYVYSDLHFIYICFFICCIKLSMWPFRLQNFKLKLPHTDWPTFAAMTIMHYVCFLYSVKSCFCLPIAFLTILTLTILSLPRFVLLPGSWISIWICLTWLMLSSLNKLANGVWTTTWISYIMKERKISQVNWWHQVWVSAIL